jgi:hypothetical protein
MTQACPKNGEFPAITSEVTGIPPARGDTRQPESSRREQLDLVSVPHLKDASPPSSIHDVRTPSSNAYSKIHILKRDVC